MSQVGRDVRASAVGWWVLASALLVMVPLAGCGSQQPEATAPSEVAEVEEAAEAEAPESVQAVSLAEAKQVFESRCSSCHGMRGAGDGPASVSLVPKPRNFHDAAWQDSVTDTHLEQVIAYGGAAVGKSAIMPGHPDLAIQPAVLAGLVDYLRSLKD